VLFNLVLSLVFVAWASASSQSGAVEHTAKHRRRARPGMVEALTAEIKRLTPANRRATSAGDGYTKSDLEKQRPDNNATTWTCSRASARAVLRHQPPCKPGSRAVSSTRSARAGRGDGRRHGCAAPLGR